MRKAHTAAIFVLLLAFLASPVFAEEMAKEGTGSTKGYYSGSYQTLAMGKERVQLNYEGFGIYVDDSGSGLLHNATSHVLGAMHIVEGVLEDSGFSVCTRPDGDKVFMTYKATGQMGSSVKGTFTIVGGTGKFTGIEGGGEFTRFALRPPDEGMFASFSVGKSHWKLP